MLLGLALHPAHENQLGIVFFQSISLSLTLKAARSAAEQCAAHKKSLLLTDCHSGMCAGRLPSPRYRLADIQKAFRSTSHSGHEEKRFPLADMDVPGPFRAHPTPLGWS